MLKHKVCAYITHEKRLLVFRHPDFPEAGIQVPAGTVEARELPEEAVMREAFEETGLTDLTLHCLLGEDTRDMADFGRVEVHHRRFYHLLYNSNPPASWRHAETHPSDSSGAHPIIFEFFWAQLPSDVPELIADHGKLLPELLKVLAL